MKRNIFFAAMILSVTAVMVSGCVKVVKIGEEAALTQKNVFDASESASSLWDEARENIRAKAVDLPSFLQEAEGDLSSLAETYGKYSMGTSGSISYAVKGSGTVEEVNQEKKAGYMTVRLDAYEGDEVIMLQIGSIYKGSSTRDSLDIIDFGDYTNQEEWAAISRELHSLIHENVVQPVKPESLEGKEITFTGTFTVDGNEELLITPVELTVK